MSAQQSPFVVKFISKAKGYGLVASRDITEGERFFEDAPVFSLQHPANCRFVAGCGYCHKLVGSAHTQMSRLLEGDGSQKMNLAIAMKSLEAGDAVFSGLVQCEGGCGELYCSSECMEADKRESHSLLCVGPLKEGHALVLFKELAVRYADTLLLAAKAMCTIVGRVRKSGGGEAAVRVEVSQLMEFTQGRWEDVASVVTPEEKEEEGEEDDGMSLRLSVQTDAHSLLKAALLPHGDEFRPFLESDEVLSRLLGLFERNNIDIEVPSPMQLVFAQRLQGTQTAQEEGATSKMEIRPVAVSVAPPPVGAPVLPFLPPLAEGEIVTGMLDERGKGGASRLQNLGIAVGAGGASPSASSCGQLSPSFPAAPPCSPIASPDRDAVTANADAVMALQAAALGSMSLSASNSPASPFPFQNPSSSSSSAAAPTFPFPSAQGGCFLESADTLTEMRAVESLVRAKEVVMRSEWDEEAEGNFQVQEEEKGGGRENGVCETIDEEMGEGEEEESPCAGGVGAEDEDEEDEEARIAAIEKEVASLSRAELAASKWPNLHGTGFYESVARMNHSCRPNVRVVNDCGDRRCAFVALKNIRAGEELCNAYTRLDAGLEIRRVNLREYGFECACERCLEEEQAGGGMQ